RRTSKVFSPRSTASKYGGCVLSSCVTISATLLLGGGLGEGGSLFFSGLESFVCLVDFQLGSGQSEVVRLGQDVFRQIEAKARGALGGSPPQVPMRGKVVSGQALNDCGGRGFLGLFLARTEYDRRVRAASV